MELETPAQAPSKTVLLIEDSATVRSFLRRVFLKQWPEANIVEAKDGREALHEMTRCKADLIVTDLQMPGMDGRSFIAKLRSNALLKRKRLLVLSSDDLQDLRDLYVEDTGIRFLKKPSSPDEIMHAIHSLEAV